MTSPLIEVGWATDVGGRSENQDRCAVSSRWAIVSDGLGGLAGGATAARLTVEAAAARLGSLEENLEGAVVEQAVMDANDAVLAGRTADKSIAGMCATLTLAAATAVADDKSDWLVCNVGDSPAWLLSAEGPLRVTEDQNVAADLVRAGRITAAAALQHPGRHVVTQAIGVGARVVPSMRAVVLRPGDALVVASDGLSELPDDVGDLLAGSASSEQMAAQLVRFALEEGATDNVTTAIVRHLA
jgi:serine/threonine protein phosphatase PrpC